VLDGEAIRTWRSEAKLSNGARGGMGMPTTPFIGPDVAGGDWSAATRPVTIGGDRFCSKEKQRGWETGEPGRLRDDTPVHKEKRRGAGAGRRRGSRVSVMAQAGRQRMHGVVVAA
jgi:hypothetical protein